MGKGVVGWKGREWAQNKDQILIFRRYPRLAKLSTDGYVTPDGAKALLDSCIQPNGPQGAQPENLDVATSSMADLPHGKDWYCC